MQTLLTQNSHMSQMLAKYEGPHVSAPEFTQFPDFELSFQLHFPLCSCSKILLTKKIKGNCNLASPEIVYSSTAFIQSTCNKTQARKAKRWRKNRFPVPSLHTFLSPIDKRKFQDFVRQVTA